ncbi:hypothetical protein KW842_01895 [Duganella sp. sic0402]|uniref:hypothetical protein n=1 Tax=Duganella sp. sic0402 TaxID=2854786 RepID=UPI001C44B0B4|nr:hypothetical protein [Duganella sp. sic0402]MBV7534509.1 hypothetical protein [Duganella sp. sic0402]
MRDIMTPHQIYPALQVLLGLPDHCISFELRVAAGQAGVAITCEHYVALDAPGLKRLESAFSEYELVHKPARVTEEWMIPWGVDRPRAGAVRAELPSTAPWPYK